MQADYTYVHVENQLLTAYSQLVVFNGELQSAVDRQDSTKAVDLINNFTFPDYGTSGESGVPGLEDILDAFSRYQMQALPRQQQIVGEINGGNWPAAAMNVDALIAQTADLKIDLDRFSTVVVQIQSAQGSRSSPPQNRIILLTAFSFGGIILLILAVGLLQTITVAIPMSQLKQSLAVWQSGDLSHRAEIRGQSEIQQLGEMMNETVDLVETGRSRFQDQVDVENTSSQDLLNDRIFGLETSLAIAQHITSIPDLDYVLPRVVELLRQRYNLYHVAIFLIDQQTDLLVLESGALIDDKRTLPINDKSLSGWAALKERPGLSEDVTQDDRYYPSSKLPYTRSELALPLMVGNELYGVLDLHSDMFAGFNRNSVLQFQSIADLIAVAVRNVRMIEGGQERSYLADALKEIGAELSATANLKDIFDLMLTHTKRLVEFDGAAVLVWNGKMLEVRATIGDCLAEKGTKITPDPNDPSDIFMRIQEAGRPYALDRPEAMDIEDKWRLLFLEGSWMAIPFMGKSNVAGIVSFSRHLLEPFSAEDRSLASTITNQSWLVLENALLQQRTKRIQQQMEFELRSRTDAIQSAYSDLEKLDETKSKFVTIASHELKTPLTIIRGYGEILQKQEKNSGENPHNLRIVEGILKGVKRINELVENLLDLSRIDYRTLEITPEPIR
ncbi:MAG: GAF domain-containing protein, partial [Chloroflexota bacterium]